MKGINYISSIKWTLAIFSVVLISSCESNQEPILNIYKANPQKVNTNLKKVIKKSNIPPDSIDPNTKPTIIPINTDSNAIKDTTETLQQLEKKTETKKYKKIYLYNIYKRPPVS